MKKKKSHIKYEQCKGGILDRYLGVGGGKVDHVKEKDARGGVDKKQRRGGGRRRSEKKKGLYRGLLWHL